jgi:hypothetical protein
MVKGGARRFILPPGRQPPKVRAGRKLCGLTNNERRRFPFPSLDFKTPARGKSQWAIHRTAGIIGEAAALQSRTRALLASAKPVLRILDRSEPLATLVAKR